MRQVTLSELKELATGKAVNRIYLHWSAGHYGQFSPAYHIHIDQNGEIYVSTDDLEEVKAHTWRRNTGALGVSLACCYKGTSNDLGPEPPTEAQINGMAAVIAALCEAIPLPLDVEHVMTHAEIADVDGYGPATTVERWDLAILRNGDEWMSGGGQLRNLARAKLEGETTGDTELGNG